MKRPAGAATAHLLHVLDEAYDKEAWHGQNLQGALRGVTARQASWRPAPGRHNIRELVVHAAYWKSRVRGRLTGEKGEPFPLAGSNWFARDGASTKAWKAERELLDREHRALRRAAAAFPAARLTRRIPGTRGRTALREIAGIALHDAYHTAQIQLLRVLQRRKRVR
jgi:DinB family protein